LAQRKARSASEVTVLISDEDGVQRLYHRGRQDKQQLVIYDNAEKQEILRAAHCNVSGPGSGRPSTTAGGVPHSGINTTLRKISERYWWRRLVEDVRSYCKTCPGCCHLGSAFPINVVTPVIDASKLEASKQFADSW